MAKRIATSSATMLLFSLQRNGSHQISVGLDHLQAILGYSCSEKPRLDNRSRAGLLSGKTRTEEEVRWKTVKRPLLKSCNCGPNW
jgi:hypothetical protein